MKIDYTNLPDKDPEYPVGGCSCVTKTPEPQYHKQSCAVWMYWRILQLEQRLKDKDNGNSNT